MEEMEEAEAQGEEVIVAARKEQARGQQQGHLGNPLIRCMREGEARGLWDTAPGIRIIRDRADLAGEAAAKAILRAAPERRTREAVEEAADAQRTVLTHVPQEPGEQADRVLSWFG